jgi:hypothetical protein
MSVYIGHSSGSKPSVAAAAAADILEAELALGGTPAASRYYGTNASAVRGFYPLPTGGGGGTTNLGITQDASTVTLSSSSGTGVVIPAATITLAGAMTAADRIKFNGIAAGATANAADSALRDRSTHTGTQLPSTITGTTTVGQALMTLANPSAIRFARINADNTVTLLDSGAFRSAIQACVEDDARLSDARTPTAHTHPASAISDSTTVGRGLMTLPNPGAVRYARINADNTVTLLDSAAFRSAIQACVEDDARLTTNLGFTRNSEEVFVTSSTGNSATILKATGLLAGVISASDQNKLNNIASFATANSSDATLLNRANHTGTQEPSTITGSTTLGHALMTLANPGAVRYARINADNTVTLLDAAAFLSAIGGGAGSPAGTGTELQFKSGTSFAAVAGSSVSGSAVTLGELRVNPSDPTTGFRVVVAGTLTQVSFLGGNANGQIYAQGITSTAAASTTLGLRAGTIRIEGPGANDSLLQFVLGNSARVVLRPRALDNLALGPADGASPAAQTLSVQSVSAGTSNTGAPVFTIDGAQCTGTAVGGTASAGDVRIRTSPAGASGSAQNAYVESLRLLAGRGLTISNGNIAAVGDCVGRITVLRGATTGSATTVLSESSLGGGLPIPLNTVIHAIVIVQGIAEDGAVSRFARQVCVKNVNGTSSVVSTNTIGSDDSGTTSLGITVTDSTDTLDIACTGVLGTNYRWSAAVYGAQHVGNIPPP